VDGSSIKPSITFPLPQGQHRPKQLNQASDTGSLTTTETLWICFIPELFIKKNLQANIEVPTN
jgi:hypothetical protein